MALETTEIDDDRFDVLGIGCTAVDERLYVSRFPAPDSKERIVKRETSLGGLTAVALVAAARMGARTAFAGRLGSDETSDFVERSLEHCGVVTEHIVRYDDARPGRSTILVDVTTGTRAVLSEVLGVRGADEALPPAELIQQSRVLYVDGHGLAGSVRATRIARERGRPVVGDFERVHDGDFDTLVALVDHLIIPESFALARTGCADCATAASALVDATRAAVVVTCGSRGGVYCVSGSAPTHYSALTVDARDTTGCGDVFHGVYAAALARGWDMATRIRYASTAAAIKACRGAGIESIPDRSCIEAWMHGVDG